MKDHDMASAGAASRLAFVAVLIAVFMIVLDTTIVNVAVPRIGAEFGGSVAGLQWVVNAYNISFAALLLIAGASADRFGAGRVFKLGLWIFMAASLACGLATSLIFLIAARTAQGVGAALMLPTALTLASHLHPLPADRARAFGAWAAVAGAATVLGPSAGGFLVDGVGWRLVFLINIPVGLLAIVMLRHISETQQAERRFDVLAQVLGAIALVGLAIGLTQSGRVGWREPGAYGPLLVAVLALVMMIRVESRAPAPFIPRELFKDRRFSIATAVGFLLSIGIYGQMFVLSIFFQEGAGYSATATGLALLPFAVTTIIGPLLAGRAIAAYGAHRVLLFGQAAGIPGSLILAFIEPNQPYWIAATGLSLLGLCQAASQPSVAAAALANIQKHNIGIASGALTSFRQVGSVVGVALLGSLMDSHRIVGGTRLALLVVTVLFAVGCFLTFVIPSRNSAPCVDMRT